MEFPVTWCCPSLVQSDQWSHRHLLFLQLCSGDPNQIGSPDQSISLSSLTCLPLIPPSHACPIIPPSHACPILPTEGETMQIEYSKGEGLKSTTHSLWRGHIRSKNLSKLQRKNCTKACTFKKKRHMYNNKTKIFT